MDFHEQIFGFHLWIWDFQKVILDIYTGILDFHKLINILTDHVGI